MHSIVSVSVPIWFNFIRIALAELFLTPFFNLSKLVVNKSSPTICTLSPTNSTSLDQESQSSSSKGSSIETIGYLLIRLHKYLIN